MSTAKKHKLLSKKAEKYKKMDGRKKKEYSITSEKERNKTTLLIRIRIPCHVLKSLKRK